METSDFNKDTTSLFTPRSDEWQVLDYEKVDSKDQKEESKKSFEDLKNMLLSSLQMQHLAVLAGSGCSLSAGGPTMQDLWNKAIGSNPSDNTKKTINSINHDLSDNNIEALLSRAESYLQIKTNDDVKELLNSCKQVILDECSSFLDSQKLENHKTLLHRLSRRRIRDQRLKIFTTNYDICFERTAAELGGVALDGFSFTAPRHYDPRFFSYDIIRRPRSGDDFGNYLEGVFLLYKLHGSVNWARHQNGTIYENQNPAPADACMIYPAIGKYQQSFSQPHLESMAQFLAAIREPGTCLLAIGFGFNDNHLAEPLLAAVETNPHLRLIIVDPNAKNNTTGSNRYWNRFFELCKRGEDIWFINANFDDFAQMIPDLKSLTPANNLVKAIQDISK